MGKRRRGCSKTYYQTGLDVLLLNQRGYGKTWKQNKYGRMYGRKCEKLREGDGSDLAITRFKWNETCTRLTGLLKTNPRRGAHAHTHTYTRAFKRALSLKQQKRLPEVFARSNHVSVRPELADCLIKLWRLWFFGWIKVRSRNTAALTINHQFWDEGVKFI